MCEGMPMCGKWIKVLLGTGKVWPESPGSTLAAVPVACMDRILAEPNGSCTRTYLVV